MYSQFKIYIFLCAAVSLALVFLLFDNEINRRLGEYYFIYSISWGVIIFFLLFIGLKFLNSINYSRLIILGILVAYLSSFFAYIISVIFDISNIRGIEQLIPSEMYLISLVFPFITLQGWAFCLIFITFISALTHLNRKYKIPKLN